MHIIYDLAGLNDEEHGTDYAEETPNNESPVTKPSVTKPPVNKTVGSGPSPSPVHLVGSGPSPTPTKEDLLKYKADSEAAWVKSLDADGKDCDKGKLPKRCYCNDGNSYAPQEIYKNDVENL